MANICLSSRCLLSTRPSLTLTTTPLALTRPFTFWLLSGDSRDTSSPADSADALWRFVALPRIAAASTTSRRPRPADHLPRLPWALTGAASRSTSSAASASCSACARRGCLQGGLCQSHIFAVCNVQHTCDAELLAQLRCYLQECLQEEYLHRDILHKQRRTIYKMQFFRYYAVLW